jgi:hypothetical protein
MVTRCLSPSSTQKCNHFALAVNPPATIYMGKDKEESRYMPLTNHQPLMDASDEELIRYGWPQDVWFHVDKVTLTQLDATRVPHSF